MPTEKTTDELREIVDIIAFGMRHTVGDLIKSTKDFRPFQIALDRICRDLIGHDPRFAAAIRQAVEDRIAGIVSVPEIREQMASDPRDPMHPYFLLLAPSWLLRQIAADMAMKDDAREGKGGRPVSLAQIIGITLHPGLFGMSDRGEDAADDNDDDHDDRFPA